MLSYEQLCLYSFTVPFRKYISLTCAIPNGMIQFVHEKKTHHNITEMAKRRLKAPGKRYQVRTNVYSSQLSRLYYILLFILPI